MLQGLICDLKLKVGNSDVWFHILWTQTMNDTNKSNTALQNLPTCSYITNTLLKTSEQKPFSMIKNCVINRRNNLLYNIKHITNTKMQSKQFFFCTASKEHTRTIIK